MTRDALTPYRKKRDFKRTPEPRGKIGRRKGALYIIQKHAATRLHYDFRLELDGTLKSWAVTRGPSLDPADKRLAVHVEDHPLDYGGFEGTIPKGDYGGGTVMLWDKGVWEPIGDARAMYKAGRLKFRLHGKKLKGVWNLVRMRPREREKRENWLLIKAHDEEAKPGQGGRLVRQAAFIALREDKMAKTITREQPKDKAAHKNKGAKRPAKPDGEASVAGVRITHPERVLYKGAGVTKLALAQYYEAIAPFILPHIAGRPLSVVRCPDGVDGQCFFQKHVMPGMPETIEKVRVSKTPGGGSYIAIDSIEGLVSLVQFGVIEIHPWGAKSKALDKPDRIVFDLDPDPELSWRTLAGAAEEVRARLEKFGLKTFLKTTGGKGLHVVVPLTPKLEWKSIKLFARLIAGQMAQERPELYIARAAKAARKGKIFVDYLRNDRGATAVAPYSARARKGAPVALPLAWEALKARAPPAAASVITLGKILKARRRDPWGDFFTSRQTLTAKALRG